MLVLYFVASLQAIFLLINLPVTRARLSLEQPATPPRWRVENYQHTISPK